MIDNKELLAWAYSKLQRFSFTDVDDALMLDEIKLLLMQDDALSAQEPPDCGNCKGRGVVGSVGFIDGHAYPEADNCPHCGGTGFEPKSEAVEVPPELVATWDKEWTVKSCHHDCGRLNIYIANRAASWALSQRGKV